MGDSLKRIKVEWWTEGDPLPPGWQAAKNPNGRWLVIEHCHSSDIAGIVVTLRIPQ